MKTTAISHFPQKHIFLRNTFSSETHVPGHLSRQGAPYLFPVHLRRRSAFSLPISPRPAQGPRDACGGHAAIPSRVGGRSVPSRGAASPRSRPVGRDAPPLPLRRWKGGLAAAPAQWPAWPLSRPVGRHATPPPAAGPARLARRRRRGRSGRGPRPLPARRYGRRRARSDAHFLSRRPSAKGALKGSTSRCWTQRPCPGRPE